MKGLVSWCTQTRLLAKPVGWMGWPLLWAGVVFAGCAMGGFLGATAYLLLGRPFGFALSFAELVANGFKDGAFLALIWFPGIGIVLLAMLAHRRMNKYLTGNGRDC